MSQFDETPKHIQTGIMEVGNQLLKRGYGQSMNESPLYYLQTDIAYNHRSPFGERGWPMSLNMGTATARLDNITVHSIDFVAFRNGPQPPEYVAVAYKGMPGYLRRDEEFVRDYGAPKLSVVSLAQLHAGLKAGIPVPEIFDKSLHVERPATFVFGAVPAAALTQ